MAILGVDPGLTGAIAKITFEGASVIDMPVVTRTGSKKNMKQIDYFSLMDKIKDLVGNDTIDMCYIEQVHAMPKQGVSSSFNFGVSYGAIIAVIASLGYPVTFVTPHHWKKRAGLLKQDKDAARTLAIQLFPNLKDELARKKDIGRADALLIANLGGAE